MRNKVINSLIIIFCVFMITCSLYTNVIKYWYMPMVTAANAYDGTVEVENANGKVSSKTYPNVIPHECVMTKDGKDYVYIVESSLKPLGFRTIVRKVQVKTLATDWVQSAVVLMNYKVKSTTFFAVERATDRLSDQMEVLLS